MITQITLITLSIHPDLTLDQTPISQGVNVTRVQREDGFSVGPMLLAAPYQYGVDWYLNLDSTSGPSFIEFLALAGIDVWVLDDPSRGWMLPGSCESGTVDCSHLGFLEVFDVGAELLAVTVDINAEWGSVRPIVGGYVGGSIFALEAIEQNPTAYSGALLWNGTLQSSDADHRAYAGAICDQLEPLVGIVPWDPTAAVFQDAFNRAREAPNDPSPYAGFLPGYGSDATNLGGLLSTLTAHYDGPSWATPSFYFFRGSENGLTYADLSTVLDIADVAPFYSSVSMAASLFCKMKQQVAYFNLDEFDGRVLALGSSGGFADQLEVTVDAFTGASSVKEHYIDGGESDRFFSPYRRILADFPVAVWAWDVLLHER